MTKQYIAAIAPCLLAFGASAQYNPTIEVEGAYKPEIILQERVNMFPERVRTADSDGRLEFDTDGVVVNFLPSGVPMQATGWKDIRKAYPWKGYASLSLGSWLNAGLNAGYRFVQNPVTLAGVYIRHNSTSLWKPEMSDETKDTRRRMYDETVGLYVRHLVPERGILDADLRYNVACFNYYGFAPEINMSQTPDAPSQTLNDLKFHALWRSAGDSRFGYHGGVDVRYTGFRSFYGMLASDKSHGTRETMITPRLGGEYRFGSASRVGLDMSADIMLYGSDKESAPAQPDNYARFTFVPYYRAEGESFSFHAGPRVDVFAGNGPALRVSPDVRFGWHTRGVGLDIRAGGGTELNSVAANRDISIYCQPLITDKTPVYTPVDAAISFGFGPFAGFKAKIEGGFRRTIHRTFAGWYTPWLNRYAQSAVPDAEEPEYLGTRRSMYGFTVGMTMAYDYCRYFGVEAGFNYQPQSDGKGYFNGWDMPEVTAHVRARSNPWSTLTFSLDWDLRACRKAPLDYVRSAAGSGGPEVVRASEKLGNLSTLSFNAGYDILPNLRVEAEVDNLLNRLDQYLLPELKTPGITAIGRVTLQF